MNWSEIQKEITRAYGEKIIKWHEHNARRIYIDIEKHDLAECRGFCLRSYMAGLSWHRELILHLV